MTTDGGSAEAAPQIPERFEVLEALPGDGGAEIMRAQDTVLLREVFLKRPGAALREAYCDEELRQRSLREARALASIQNPAVDKLLDVIETETGPLLVLEPTRGESLASRLNREGRLAPDEVVQLGVALCGALEEVHEAGIVHRGISDQCIVIDEDGDVHLTGFHFAKPGAEAGASKTTSSLAFGPPSTDPTMPRHPAPEQLTKGEDDPRSDLFGLGWVLYESLTGHPPYRGSNPIEWEAAKDARKFAPQTPLPLSRALAMCLAKSPANRPANAGALSSALQQSPSGDPEATSGETASAAPSVPAAPARRDWISPVLAIVSAGVIAFLLAGGALRSEKGDDGAAQARGGVSRPSTAKRKAPLLSRYENSWALLIGIGEAYADKEYQALRNAENDVKAVEAALRQNTQGTWNIKTVEGKEATGDRIINELAAMSDDAGINDRILVYYAGHGLPNPRNDERGWVVPVNAKSDDESTLVPFEHFLWILRDVQAKHVMVVMDCCYGGRLVNLRSGAGERYAKRLLQQPAKVVLTSGRDNEKTSDGEGSNSPFTEAFVAALEGEGPLTSIDLYASIRKTFVDDDRIPHTPKYGYPRGVSPEGDFIFFRKDD